MTGSSGPSMVAPPESFPLWYSLGEIDHESQVSDNRPCERGAVYRDHLESVAMKVHRMRHHRMVHHLDLHALTVGDHQWGYVGPVFAIQRPSIWRHGAGEDHAVGYVGRARR